MTGPARSPQAGGPDAAGGQASGSRRKPEHSAQATLLRRPRRALRRGLTQTICAGAGLAAGLAMPAISFGPQAQGAKVANVLFTIGFGVISLVSIIYSLLFLVVQFAATTFSPRLGLFREDPIVWRTFAFAVGVFIFCVTAGLAIGTRDEVSAAVPVLAMVLALAVLSFIRVLQTKAFASIQLAPALDAITARAVRAFDVLYVRAFRPDGGGSVPSDDDGPDGPDVRDSPYASDTSTTVVWNGPGTVLQQIDVPALAAAAGAHGTVVEFRATIGDRLLRGRPVAVLHGGALDAQAVLNALVTGPERTFDQDPALAFRLLSDISLRALSAAVNDPATAVQTLDHIEDLLLRLVDRDLAIGRVDGPDGRLRLVVRVSGWDHYVRLAVDDVIVAATGSPMALLRLRDLLVRVRDRCPFVRREVVDERLRWVERTGARNHPLIWRTAPRAPAGADELM